MHYLTARSLDNGTRHAAGRTLPLVPDRSRSVCPENEIDDYLGERVRATGADLFAHCGTDGLPMRISLMQPRGRPLRALLTTPQPLQGLGFNLLKRNTAIATLANRYAKSCVHACFNPLPMTTSDKHAAWWHTGDHTWNAGRVQPSSSH